MKNSLLKNTFFALILTMICTLVCYLFLDRPIAFWVNEQHFSSYPFFRWIAFIATGIAGGSAIYIPIFSFLAIKRPLKKTEKTILFACLSVAIASFLKDSLKILFGRYWISTWVHQNPSLLENQAYGFHFLHSGTAYESFPSGHTVIVTSAMTFLWIFAPKWRFLALLLVFLEISGLIAMNYHFLSDILAGAFLGIFSSLFIIQMAKLRP